MNEVSGFRMWGERGLVATFFADLWRLSDLAVANEFLVRAGFPESMTKHLGDIQRVIKGVRYIFRPSGRAG